MAAESVRSGFMGWFRKPPKPDFRGTKAAFEAGEKVFAKTNGPTPELRRVVRMHFSNVDPEA